MSYVVQVGVQQKLVPSLYLPCLRDVLGFGRCQGWSRYIEPCNRDRVRRFNKILECRFPWRKIEICSCRFDSLSYRCSAYIPSRVCCAPMDGTLVRHARGRLISSCRILGIQRPSASSRLRLRSDRGCDKRAWNFLQRFSFCLCVYIT